MWSRTRLLVLLVLVGSYPAFLFSQTIAPQIVWQQVNAHPSAATTVEFSPDGSRLASGAAFVELTGGGQTYYAQIKTWQGKTGAPISETPENFQRGGTNEVSYAPNGVRIAAAIGATYCAPKGGCGSTAPGATLYDSASLAELVFDPTYPINATVDNSPDGQFIATGEYYGDFRIRVRNASDLSVVHILPGHSVSPYDGATWTLRFTPNSQYLVSGGQDNNIKVWNPVTGDLVRTIPFGTNSYYGVGSLAISPDGLYVAASDIQQFGDARVKVFRLSTGAEVRNFSTNSGDSAAVRWTRDGMYVVAAVDRYYATTSVRFFNFRKGVLAAEVVDPRNPTRKIYALDFAPPDGSTYGYTWGRDIIVARNPVASIIASDHPED
jgi:WD40 repeat protein